jgi:hypothetical protein
MKPVYFNSLLIVTLLLNCARGHAMEMPDYEKRKQGAIEIERTNLCSICKNKIEIKDDIRATSCCKKFICDKCILAKVTKSVQAGLDVSMKTKSNASLRRCPSCKNKFKILKAIFPPTIFDVIRAGNIDAMKSQFLSKPLINLEGEDSNGDTPLVLATKLGNRSIVQALVKRGAVLSRPVQGYSALHYAALYGQDSVLSYFMMCAENDIKERKIKEREGKVKIVDPIHEEKKEEEVFVDILGDNDETPLMCACKTSKLSAIKVLLGYKADPTLQNKSGQDSFAITEKCTGNEKVREEILAVLKAHSKKSS